MLTPEGILRNWIVSAWIKRVASNDSTECQPGPFDCSVLVNGLVAVMGTRGVKPARVCRKGAGKRRLVQSDQDQQNPTREVAQRKWQITQTRFVGMFALNHESPQHTAYQPAPKAGSTPIEFRQSWPVEWLGAPK